LARTWEAASAVFFLYTVAVALLHRRPPLAGRQRAIIVAVAGLAMVGVSRVLPEQRVLHGWLIPPALLLLAYWASGLLFVAPMPRAERAFLALDQAFGIRQIAAGTPRLIAELLEVAYAGVYPLIPFALAVHLVATPRPDADRFWSVILITDFVCFSTLPWLQMRPPRTIEGGSPWSARLRVFNVRLLHATSIHVNTFPSGHAAEALAAALLAIGAPGLLVAAMFMAAFAISAGTVLGRYHYVIDAVAGWMVAAIVWYALGR
jgi:membrane-associated phospholipid phosphatase